MSMTFNFQDNKVINRRVNIREIENYNYDPKTGKVSNPNTRARKYYVDLSFEKGTPTPFYLMKKKNESGYTKVYIDTIVKSIFPEYFRYAYVTHRDGNPFHNNIENLETSIYPEKFDEYIENKIAKKEIITEKDFEEHPVVINYCEFGDRRRFYYSGNYDETKMLYIDDIEHNYCFDYESGSIVNKKTDIIIKPNLRILASMKSKGDIPLYVFYRFDISEEKKAEKLLENPDTKNFGKQFTIDEIAKYIDHKKFNKEYVRHIDGNLLNNRLDNLEPCDEREIMTKEHLEKYTKLMDIEYESEESLENSIENILTSDKNELKSIFEAHPEYREQLLAILSK